VTDINGCTATSTATTVNVSNAPAPTINATATQACAGDIVTITASTSDSYLWSTGATTQSIDVNATATNVNVVTTNANACNGVGASAPITVTFNATPTAAGTMTLAGNVATFTNTSTGATSYSWDFGDFTNSSATAPAHAYAVNGSYTVVLTAINGNCTDTTIFLVDVTVGLNEMASSSNLTIFPNPANETVNVSFDQNTNDLIQIELIDATGRVIAQNQSIEIGTNNVSFDVNTLSSGFYTVRLTNANGIENKKLMIQK
jgi:PKD repeat protein